MLFLLLLAPPFLFASVNLVDKFLVNGQGEDSQTGVLVAITGFFNLVIAILLGAWMFFSNITISTSTLLPLMVNGGVYMLAIWLYLFAMKNDEPSRVIPWFQTIPLFGLVGAVIALNEIPTKTQLISIALLVIGGLTLSIHNGVVKKKLMLLMLMSSGLLALNDVVFAEIGRGNNEVSVIFADLAGKAFFGLLVLIRRKYRRGFITGMKSKFALQSAGEIVNIIADAILDLAKLYVPIAVVQAFCCTQPMFVLIGACILTKYFSKVVSEEMEGTLLKKFGGITLMVTGGVILALNS